ncbi:hypothetical protein LRP50_13975 [Enterovibrio sp. ZSDZ42]|uniref:Uncharacterized protein n=1 Tax=Enterovibrio gelatinilyticus TaxID=2899819 RepID=A0ABT5R2Z8_9GAMM|nr:hypothetical protein [Enterovibrio sp. ZSDZ42]MDD1794245.1 hypothetical protein [Enterovibrio sp. ZSDZ42]
MEAIKQTESISIEHQWQAELVGTEMFWADLLDDERFADESGSMSQYVVDYRANLKDHIVNVIAKPRVFLFGLREKVRFNYFRQPSYNFLTKKTKFHLFVGVKAKPVTISIKLSDFFFKDLPRPKIILEPHFVTLMKSQADNVTLSVHDFLSTVGADLGFQCDVIATGSSLSPYWGEIEDKSQSLTAFFNEAKRYEAKGKDLVVYLNDYQLSTTSSLLSNAVVDENIDGLFEQPFDGISDKEEPDEDANNESLEMDAHQLLMLSRCFTLYFLGRDVRNSVMIKNAENNLSRYMKRMSVSLIDIDHAYLSEGDYINLGSQEIPHSSSHVFSIEQEQGKLSMEKPTE